MNKKQYTIYLRFVLVLVIGCLVLTGSFLIKANPWMTVLSFLAFLYCTQWLSNISDAIAEERKKGWPKD